MKPKPLGQDSESPHMKWRSEYNEGMHFNVVTLTPNNTWRDSMMSVVHIPTVASLASPCRPLTRPNGRQRQPPTTAPESHCPAYCDAPPHLRQRSPVAAALKRLLPKRSMSPQVRGHLWPLVSPTTGRQTPKTLHPPTHPPTNACTLTFFFCPYTPVQAKKPWSESQ